MFNKFNFTRKSLLYPLVAYRRYISNININSAKRCNFAVLFSRLYLQSAI